MKESRIIWLSILGYVILDGSIRRNIWSTKPFDNDLWLRYLAKSLGLFVGCIILPAGLMMVLYDCISRYVSYFCGELFLFIVWAEVYVSGVFAASKLQKWKIEHIPGSK